MRSSLQIQSNTVTSNPRVQLPTYPKNIHVLSITEYLDGVACVVLVDSSFPLPRQNWE